MSSCPNIITISTNTTGFQLLFKSNSANLVNTTNNSYVIASTTNTTANALPVNAWGYAIPATNNATNPNHSILGIPSTMLTNFNNSYTTRTDITPIPSDKYAKTPTTDTVIKQLSLNTTPTAALQDNQTTVYYAATADLNTKAGEYKARMTYTGVGEEIAEPV
ncbi:MAG: hypothetical protein LBU20_00165, partial [Candidatus Nomurabacteria bacterium]|nr:hypothetical protein [Candidatus Nomurabacteria bacterium]